MNLRPALAAAVAALLTAGCAAIPGYRDDPEQIVVGVDLNLTGRGSEFGTVFHNALQLQVERLNRRQRLGEGRQLRLAIRDNRGDPEVAAANLADLLADPRVSAIVTAGCPDCVVALAPELTAPVISLDPDTGVAAPAAERRWVFRIGPGAADNADALSAAMAEAGVATVAVIAADTPYGRDGMGAVADAARRDQLAIVERREIPADDPAAVAAAAERVAGWRATPVDPFTGPAGEPAAGPDAVVGWVPAPHAATVTRALRDAGYRGPVYLDMLAADELFLGDGVGEASLVFTPTLVVDTRFVTSPALSQRRRWFSDYLSRYGTYHAHSSFAADALLVLADAVRSGGADRAGIRDTLESSRVDGITGQIRFTGDQHAGLLPSSLTVLTAGDGRWR